MSYGLAAYPGDPCYDSGRPSMLPYWLDDFTESDCKYNASNIVQASINAFGDPGQVASNVGGVTGQAVGSGVNAIASGIASTASGIAGTLDWSGILLVGGLLLAGVILIPKLARL